MTPSANSLSVYMDETGGERLKDPGSPFFGVGGCAQLSREFENSVNVPWRKLRQEQFPDVEGPLHAVEISKDLPLEKSAALGTFFRQEKFYRPAVVVIRDTKKPNEMLEVECAVLAFAGKIGDLARESGCDEIFLVIEKSDRLQVPYMNAFSKFRALDESGRAIPLVAGFMDKQLAQPGLEIADFILNAVAPQTRRWISGDCRLRQDFTAIFDGYPGPMLIKEISPAD